MRNSTSLQHIQNSGGLFTVEIKVSLLHTLNLIVQSLVLFLQTAEHPQLTPTRVVTLNAQHFRGWKSVKSTKYYIKVLWVNKWESVFILSQIQLVVSISIFCCDRINVYLSYKAQISWLSCKRDAVSLYSS